MNEAEVQQRVGAAFARRRSAKKLSPTALAKAAGVDVKTVRAFEAGERWPQDTSRAKIESALDLAVGTADELRVKLTSLPDGYSHIDRRIREALQRSDLSFSSPAESDDSHPSVAAADMAEQLRSLAVLLREARNVAVHGGNDRERNHEKIVQAVVAADALITVIMQAMPDVLGPVARRNRSASPEPLLESIPHIVDWMRTPTEDEPAAARQAAGRTKGEQLHDQFADLGEESQDPGGDH
ncbi:helix-turn-helix DNA binding domain protein [Gordonia phage Murp]|nr:helix-turn-helix DNA binding domain protein [Gordonia phage Murp]